MLTNTEANLTKTLQGRQIVNDEMFATGIATDLFAIVLVNTYVEQVRSSRPFATVSKKSGLKAKLLHM